MSHDLGHEVADREDHGIDPPAFADHRLYIIGDCRFYRHARKRLLDDRPQQLAVLIFVYLTPVADSDERGRERLPLPVQLMVVSVGDDTGTRMQVIHYQGRLHAPGGEEPLA